MKFHCMKCAQFLQGPCLASYHERWGSVKPRLTTCLLVCLCGFRRLERTTIAWRTQKAELTTTRNASCLENRQLFLINLVVKRQKRSRGLRANLVIIASFHPYQINNPTVCHNTSHMSGFLHTRLTWNPQTQHFNVFKPIFQQHACMFPYSLFSRKRCKCCNAAFSHKKALITQCPVRCISFS